MSYFKKIEYEIVPEKSFRVIRNCAGCGKKTFFENTKKFRVNANGNKLDVWLIYQCEKCKHTFNLAIYERQKASSIPENEYSRFLDNDEELAKIYGKSMPLFKKNKAEIDFSSISYRLVKRENAAQDIMQDISGLNTADKVISGQETELIIHNPCSLKIRPEKQIAGILGLSASKVKKMMEQEKIQVETILPQFLAVKIEGDFPESAVLPLQ